NIEWYLKERPAVFGEDIHLVCKLPNETTCCDFYNRKWNVGTDSKVAVMNGLSLNKTKFSEELNKIDHESILTIKSFDEGDLNKPFQCVYGFFKYKSTLQLDNTRFEYHPDVNLPIEPEIDGNNFTVKVVFEKVFPFPSCRAVVGLKNISSSLNISNKRKTLFYQSIITLNYAKSEEGCKGSLQVICKVGQKVLKVVDYKKACSNTQDHQPSSLSTGSIAVIVVFSTIGIICLIALVVCVRKLCGESTY
ncbi:Hypothetical predicted protein, partial [Mytilus galloprovincialis]